MGCKGKDGWMKMLGRGIEGRLWGIASYHFVI